MDPNRHRFEGSSGKVLGIDGVTEGRTIEKTFRIIKKTVRAFISDSLFDLKNEIPLFAWAPGTGVGIQKAGDVHAGSGILTAAF